MAEYIDPWGGMEQGVQTLRDAAESQGMQRTRNIQNESASIDLGMKQAMAPRMQQAAMEDVTARIDASTMQQIGAIAEASRFVRGNPTMAKEIGDKMGVSPEMLMNIKEVEPNIHTLDVGDGNTIVVARDAKGGMKVMKTTDPQLEQKHQYRMEENQAKYAAALANSLAGIAARGATGGQKVMNRRFQVGGVNSEGRPVIFDTVTGKFTVGSIDGEGNAVTPEGQIADDSQGTTPPPQGDGTVYPKSAAAALSGNQGAKDKINAMNIAKSPVFANKAITVQAMPVILDEVVKAGKKLNYPQAKFAGMAQQWMQGQLNDPDLVAYMTLRNDALLSIASVMRGTGATDQAHRVEMEAMNPTLTPQALDAWIGAQKTALAPRLEAYDKIYGKKTPLSQNTEGTIPPVVPNTQAPATGDTVKAAPPVATTPTDRVFSELPPNTQAAVRNTPEYKNAKPGDSFQVKGKSGIITIIKR